MVIEANTRRGMRMKTIFKLIVVDIVTAIVMYYTRKLLTNVFKLVNLK